VTLSQYKVFRSHFNKQHKYEGGIGQFLKFTNCDFTCHVGDFPKSPKRTLFVSVLC